ncbi:hypothetical protein HAX54_023377 [Datura stramonium]|uniref:Uncharacterized protein n=1 Tax=Datura stramonium TaxID=4076 RepID=A0ABS8S4L8_DATST|nr:hypothetical protein [Datura stramonium]
MTGRPINIKVVIRDFSRRMKVKKGQRFSFKGLLNRFLRVQQVEEEEVDYRPRYGPKGLDVTKTKESEGLHDPVLFINEHARIDNVLSHLYGMQIIQMRMRGVKEELLQQLNINYPLSEHSRAFCRVGPILEEPFDDDDPNNDEQAQVDSYLEFDDDDGKDSEMGKLPMPPRTMRTRPKKDKSDGFWLIWGLKEQVLSSQTQKKLVSQQNRGCHHTTQAVHRPARRGHIGAPSYAMRHHIGAIEGMVQTKGVRPNFCKTKS